MDQSERYLTRLRRTLVCPKEDKERLLEDAKAMLENFTQENPGAFYKDYVASFGQPEDFAAEMLSNLDPEDVSEAQARRKRAVLGTVAAAAALLVLMAGFWFGRQSQGQPSVEVTPTPTVESTPEPTPEISEPPVSSPASIEDYLAQVYIDSGEIVHREAAAVMTKLEIINPKGDGDFRPEEQALTRALAAKLAALIMAGGEDLNTGVKAVPTFSDIQGHWAESYIEYCLDMGIMDGKEDGSFGPDDVITGLELARIAERMLGYDADAYRLRGEDWAVRTDELARIMVPSLYEGLEGAVMSAPVTWDDAVQILFNTLRATPKRVVPYHNTTDGTITWQYVDSTKSDGTPSTLLWERFELDLEDVSFD